MASKWPPSPEGCSRNFPISLRSRKSQKHQLEVRSHLPQTLPSYALPSKSPDICVASVILPPLYGGKWVIPTCLAYQEHS